MDYYSGWRNAHCSLACFDARTRCPRCPDEVTWLAWYYGTWLPAKVAEHKAGR